MSDARRLSARLRAVVNALPLQPGMRVLEIGGAPGAAARAVVARVAPGGHVLVLDRSARGIDRTRLACADEIATGSLSTLCASVEDFILDPDQDRFDLAFACRVGVLDGRHPDKSTQALDRIRAALRPHGRLFIDTEDPVRPIRLLPLP